MLPFGAILIPFVSGFAFEVSFKKSGEKVSTLSWADWASEPTVLEVSAGCLPLSPNESHSPPALLSLQEVKPLRMVQ